MGEFTKIIYIRNSKKLNYPCIGVITLPEFIELTKNREDAKWCFDWRSNEAHHWYIGEDCSQSLLDYELLKLKRLIYLEVEHGD